MYTELPLKEHEKFREDGEFENLPSNCKIRNSRVNTTYKIVVFSLFITAFAIVAMWLLVSKISLSSSSRSCINPVVRREWRQLNTSEKSNYISAVKCLQTHPSITTGVGRLSDDFPWVHRRMNQHIHNSALFLPWHRYFIHLYERYLQTLCRYDGVLPYWDWGLDWQDPTKSAIWDPVSGFGGDGDLNQPTTVGYGSCVSDGPFVGYEVLWFKFTPRLHCLSRGFGRQFNKSFPTKPFSPPALHDILQQNTFEQFNVALEAGPHDAVPNNVGGDFTTVESPNDPVFFLHHANLDRLWWQWQKSRPRQLWEYKGRKNSFSKQAASLKDEINMKGLGDDKIVKDLMDTQLGELCYTYS